MFPPRGVNNKHISPSVPHNKADQSGTRTETRPRTSICSTLTFKIQFPNSETPAIRYSKLKKLEVCATTHRNFTPGVRLRIADAIFVQLCSIFYFYGLWTVPSPLMRCERCGVSVRYRVSVVSVRAFHTASGTINGIEMAAQSIVGVQFVRLAFTWLKSENMILATSTIQSFLGWMRYMRMRNVFGTCSIWEL